MKKIELRTAYLWIFFLKVNFIHKEKLFITSIMNSIILQKTCPFQQPSRRLNNPARTDERTGESFISVNIARAFLLFGPIARIFARALLCCMLFT